MAVVVPSSSSDQIPPHSSSNTPTQSNPLPQSSNLQGDSNHEAVDVHERKPELMESFQSQEPSVFEDRSLKEAEFDPDATNVNATTGRDVTPGDGVSVLEASVGFSSSHAGISVSNLSDCETLLNLIYLSVFRYVKKLVSEKHKLETRVRELEVTNKKLGEDLRHATSHLTLLKANMQKDLDLASKSLDDLSIQLESSKMSESLLRVQVGTFESPKSQLVSQVENLGTEKSVLVSQVEKLEAEKSEVEKLEAEKSLLTTLAQEKLSLEGKVSNLDTTVAEKVDLVQRLTDKLDPCCQEDLDTDYTEKYKKYEADYVRRIKAKYFSKKNLYGGNIFENETTIENEVIKSSRWPSTRSYTDPVQSFEDHSRSSSTSAAETSANLSSRKYQSKKSSS